MAELAHLQQEVVEDSNPVAFHAKISVGMKPLLESSPIAKAADNMDPNNESIFSTDVKYWLGDRFEESAHEYNHTSRCLFDETNTAATKVVATTTTTNTNTTTTTSSLDDEYRQIRAAGGLFGHSSTSSSPGANTSASTSVTKSFSDPVDFSAYFEGNDGDATTDTSTTTTTRTSTRTTRKTKPRDGDGDDDATVLMGMHRTHPFPLSPLYPHLSKDTHVTGLPACVRLHAVLAERGYSPLELSPADVDPTHHTLAVDVVNAWGENLLLCTQELFAQLDHARRAVQDVSHSLRKGGLSQTALQARVGALEGQLKEARRKAARMELNNTVLEEEKVVRTRWVGAD